MIDFWGIGYDVAEKMDLLDQLQEAHYKIPKLLFVDEDNKKKGSLNIREMRKRVDFRHFNLLRSDLEQILFNQLKDEIEFRYSLSIDSFTQTSDKVKVRFSDGTEQFFDFLIGADGQHSNTRVLLFGAEKQFETFLGYYTASYTISNFLDEDRIFYSYSVPKKQIGIYSIREDHLATFFIWKSEKLDYSQRIGTEAPSFRAGRKCR